MQGAPRVLHGLAIAAHYYLLATEPQTGGRRICPLPKSSGASSAQAETAIAIFYCGTEMLLAERA